MRTINDHKTTELNNALTITAIDDKGAGGANHHYAVEGINLSKNKSFVGPYVNDTSLHIYFQNGGLVNNSPNGVTQEALLAIVIDRLESFQSGPYPSVENSDALAYCRKALTSLHSRTHDRIRRGVEGLEAK